MMVIRMNEPEQHTAQTTKHDHEEHLHKADWLLILDYVLVFLGIVFAAWITGYFSRKKRDDS